MSDDSAIVLFGGLAKDRPYPGSTTVSTVNGGVVALTRTLATELAPIRVNAIHPGIVGNSPYWKDKSLDQVIDPHADAAACATMADVTDAVRFLLENRSVNGVDLRVDGGWMIDLTMARGRPPRATRLPGDRGAPARPPPRAGALSCGTWPTAWACRPA